MSSSQVILNELPKKRKIILTVTVLLCLAEILFFNGLARTVGTFIVADLGNVNLFTLMNTIFFLCSTLTMPLACKLGDKFGRSRIILIGISVYSFSMLFAGMSNTMMAHLIFRGGQGFGQGIMLANCLIAIGELYSGPEKAKYLGLYGTVTGICNVFSPTIGGLIYESFGWRWCFYGTVIVGAVLFVLLTTQFPNVRKEGKITLDIVGTLLLATASTCAVFVFSLTSQRFAWSDPTIIIMIIVAILSATAFILYEQKFTEPIVPMHLFKNRNFTLCVIAACCIWPAMFSSNAYFILYANSIRGMTAVESGAILSIQSFFSIISGIVIGWLLAKFSNSAKVILAALTGLYACFMFVQSSSTMTTPILVLTIMMSTIGFCNGAALGAFTAVIQNNLEKKLISAGTATLQCFQSLTGTIGLSVMGLILNTGFSARLANVIPEGLADLVPMEQLSNYLRADALVKSAETAEFASSLTGRAQTLFNEMIINLNNAYASSLKTVFITLFCLLSIAFIAMLMLKRNDIGSSKKVVEM